MIEGQSQMVRSISYGVHKKVFQTNSITKSLLTVVPPVYAGDKEVCDVYKSRYYLKCFLFSTTGLCL